MIDLSVLQMLGLGALFLGVLIGLAIWEHWFKKPKPLAVSATGINPATYYSMSSVSHDETLAQAVVRRGIPIDWPALADFAGHTPNNVSNDGVIDAYVASTKVGK